MKRYCKSVDITDTEFIRHCIYLWLDKKKSRRDVRRFLAAYTSLSFREVNEAMSCEDYWFLPEAIERIAEDVRNRILERSLKLPEITFRDRYDDCCKKWRKIGVQKPIHQIFDYIAVEGCKELFRTKIGPYQMASIKGRGQEAGVKAIQKWMQLDPDHTRYFVKADIQKCYPSIDHDVIKALFSRDIKNPTLLWLVCTLIDAFPEGLSIGSYFSQYGCNYFLAKAYHFISEKLVKIRKKKNGKTERIRLVYHQLFFMDDILLFGSSKKDLQKGMEMLTDFFATELRLHVKQDWRIYPTDYIDRQGIRRGHFVDMMGYRIYRDHITIRRHTFKRMRRTVIRVESFVKSGKSIPLEMARRFLAQTGKLEHSDSFQFSKKHNIPLLKSRSKKVVSEHDKAMEAEKKRRKQIYAEQRSALSGSSGGDHCQPDEHWGNGGVDPKEHHADHCPF